MSDAALKLFKHYQTAFLDFATGETEATPRLPRDASPAEKLVYDRARLEAAEQLVINGNKERLAHYSAWFGQIHGDTGNIQANTGILRGNYSLKNNRPALDTNGDGKLHGGLGGDEIRVNSADRKSYIDAVATAEAVGLTAELLGTGRRPSADALRVNTNKAERSFQWQFTSNHDYGALHTKRLRMQHGYEGLPTIDETRLESLIAITRTARQPREPVSSPAPVAPHNRENNAASNETEARPATAAEKPSASDAPALKATSATSQKPPTAARSAIPALGQHGYTVRAGDTLYGIAQAQTDMLAQVQAELGDGVSSHESTLALALMLARKNGIADIDVIAAGQVINPPTAEEIKLGAVSLKSGVMQGGLHYHEVKDANVAQVVTLSAPVASAAAGAPQPDPIGDKLEEVGGAHGTAPAVATAARMQVAESQPAADKTPTPTPASAVPGPRSVEMPPY